MRAIALLLLFGWSLSACSQETIKTKLPEKLKGRGWDISVLAINEDVKNKRVYVICHMQKLHADTLNPPDDYEDQVKIIVPGWTSKGKYVQYWVFKDTRSGHPAFLVHRDYRYFEKMSQNGFRRCSVLAKPVPFVREGQ